MADYETLTTADRLAIARDVLRGRESDRFRVSILSEPNKEQRLAAYDDEIEGIKAVIDELEAEVEAETPVDPEPVVPAEPDEPIQE